jgi:hypothetical protein
MTVQTENAKIAAAMNGQAAVRKTSTKERATSGFGKPKAAPKPESIKTRKPRPGGPGSPVDKAAVESDRKARAHAARMVKMATPKPEPKPKVVRVLDDPIANAKLIWMRAKWAAQRQDVRTAKVEAEFENFTTEDAVAKVAQVHSLSAAAWTEAEDKKAEYAEMRLAAKAAAKAS